MPFGRSDSDESSSGVRQESNEALPKKKDKGIMTSLKRFLGRQQRGADSAGQLRPSPGPHRPPSPNSSGILSSGQSNAQFVGQDFSAHAPARSSASMPLLFPQSGSPRSALSTCLPSPLVSGSGRGVLPSNSALLQLPSIEPCAPPLSSGAMADRSNHGQPLFMPIKEAGTRHGVFRAESSPLEPALAGLSSASLPLPQLHMGRPVIAFAAGAATPITPTNNAYRPTTSTLLAVCPGAPAGMRRPVWSLMDYTVGSRLYKGEVSSVYKAVCNHSGVHVALKVYSLTRVADNSLHTLVREVKIHTDLAHGNILMMYGVFEEENRLVLVLERAARGDLFHVHRSLPNCRMSEDQLRVLVLVPLLDALVFLHSRGVCHRDIKPENLLLTSNWQLRLADFGAAINLAQERAVTRTGTMDYMAPEVERCPLKLAPEDNKDNPELAYTTAADVWSVGVLAYELLVGFPPFVAGKEEAGGAGGGGDCDAAGRRGLSFPHFMSAGGQDFISSALAERPGDRPTATQLLRHPWLKHAVRQHQARQRQQAEQEPPAGVRPPRQARSSASLLGVSSSGITVQQAVGAR